MYVAFCGSPRSLRVCWRGIWWVVHTHACGGLSLSFLSSPSSLPALSVFSLLSPLLGLSHSEPLEQFIESTIRTPEQGAMVFSMGLGTRCGFLRDLGYML